VDEKGGPAATAIADRTGIDGCGTPLGTKPQLQPQYFPPFPADEYISAMRRAPFKVHELLSSGVPIEAIALACPVPTRIALKEGRNRYEPDPDGRPAWIVPVTAVDPEMPDRIESIDPDAVISGSNIIDTVAFSLTHNEFPLRTRLGSVLGVVRPQYCEPEPVPVHRSVLGWLRASCCGIMILTSDRVEAGRILRQIARLRSGEDDEEHADEIEAKTADRLSAARVAPVRSAQRDTRHSPSKSCQRGVRVGAARSGGCYGR